MNGLYAILYGIFMLFVALVRALRALVIVIAMKITKSMKWFRPFGWFYRPIAWPGYAVFFVVSVFCLHILIAAFMNAGSAGDALYAAFPFVVPALGAYVWIGSKAS